MHDTLEYMSKDPVYRRYHHNDMTFGFLYAWTENFVLPLSHDEVVHGKGSLLSRMSGDRWQQFANLRALFGWMWAYPGKKLLFMGGEFGQDAEWAHDRSIDWHLVQFPEHRGLQRLVQDLGARYRETPALWERDHDPDGFRWIDAANVDQNVFIFLRRDGEGRPCLLYTSVSPPWSTMGGGRWSSSTEDVYKRQASVRGGISPETPPSAFSPARGQRPCSASPTRGRRRASHGRRR